MMKRWHGSCIGAFLALLIGGSSLIFLVPVGGALIAGIPPLFDRLTAYALCPDASAYSYRDFGFGTPTTSSPSGGTGHFTELTCTYADGSQKVFGNEEVGIKGLAASFTAAGMCGGMVVLLLMIPAALIGSKLVRPKTTPAG
jgi:hypothetical protein